MKQNPQLCVMSETMCIDWFAAGKSYSAVWKDVCPGIDDPSFPNTITLAKVCPKMCSQNAKENPNSLCVTNDNMCGNWLAAGKPCSAVWKDECPGIGDPSFPNTITLAEVCPKMCSQDAKQLDRSYQVLCCGMEERTCKY